MTEPTLAAKGWSVSVASDGDWDAVQGNTHKRFGNRHVAICWARGRHASDRVCPKCPPCVPDPPSPKDLWAHACHSATHRHEPHVWSVILDKQEGASSRKIASGKARTHEFAREDAIWAILDEFESRRWDFVDFEKIDKYITIPPKWYDCDLFLGFRSVIKTDDPSVFLVYIAAE